MTKGASKKTYIVITWLLIIANLAVFLKNANTVNFFQFFAYIIFICFLAVASIEIWCEKEYSRNIAIMAAIVIFLFAPIVHNIKELITGVGISMLGAIAILLWLSLPPTPPGIHLGRYCNHRRSILPLVVLSLMIVFGSYTLLLRIGPFNEIIILMLGSLSRLSVGEPNVIAEWISNNSFKKSIFMVVMLFALIGAVGQSYHVSGFTLMVNNWFFLMGGIMLPEVLTFSKSQSK